MTLSRQSLALAIYILLMAFALFMVTQRLQITSDMSLFLPDGASQAQTLLSYQMKRGLNGKSVLISIEGWNDDVTTVELVKANKALVRRLRGSDYFAFVSNGHGRLPDSAESMLFKYRYALSPDVARNFTAIGLRQKLELRQDELATGLTPRLKKLLKLDPTGELLTVARLWQPPGEIHKVQGVFVSQDGRRSLLLAMLRGDVANLDAQQLAIDFISSSFDKLAGNSLRLRMSGPVVIAVNTRNAIRSDVQVLSILATVLVIIFLFFAFRSWQAVLLSAIPLLTGIVVGIATVSLYFGSIHGITMAFGSTLIGVAVDYPMHFFSHLVVKGGTVQQRFARIWPTLRLGVLTSIVGFSVLIFSSYPGLVQLGIFSVAGLGAAALTTRWVLPMLMNDSFVLPQTMPAVQEVFLQFASYLPRLKKGFIVLVIAALGWMLYQGESIWEDALVKLSPVSEQQLQLDRQLRQDLNTLNANHMLLLLADSREQVLQRVEALEIRLKQWRQSGALKDYSSIASLLPSRSVQAQRLSDLPGPAQLEIALRQALTGLALRPDIFQSFLHEVERARQQAPLELEDYYNTPLNERVRTLLFQYGRQWVAPVLLYGETMPASLIAMARNDPEMLFIALREETTGMMRGYRHRALWLLSVGALLILVMLFLGLRSLPEALRVLSVPVAVVLIDAALIVLLQGGLTLFHLIALLLVVGLGLDYTLFFNRLRRHEHEWQSTFPALWKSWLTTVLVFGSLNLSSAPVLKAIGLTVGVGVSLCFILGLVWGADARTRSLAH